MVTAFLKNKHYLLVQGFYRLSQKESQVTSNQDAYKYGYPLNGFNFPPLKTCKDVMSSLLYKDGPFLSKKIQFLLFQLWKTMFLPVFKLMVSVTLPTVKQQSCLCRERISSSPLPHYKDECVELCRHILYLWSVSFWFC